MSQGQGEPTVSVSPHGNYADVTLRYPISSFFIKGTLTLLAADGLEKRADGGVLSGGRDEKHSGKRSRPCMLSTATRIREGIFSLLQEFNATKVRLQENEGEITRLRMLRHGDHNASVLSDHRRISTNNSTICSGHLSGDTSNRNSYGSSSCSLPSRSSSASPSLPSIGREKT